MEAPQGHGTADSHANVPILAPHLAHKSLLSAREWHTSIQWSGSRNTPFWQVFGVCPFLTIFIVSSADSSANIRSRRFRQLIRSPAQWGKTFSLQAKVERHFLHLYWVWIRCCLNVTPLLEAENWHNTVSWNPKSTKENCPKNWGYGKLQWAHYLMRFEPNWKKNPPE